MHDLVREFRVLLRNRREEEFSKWTDHDDHVRFTRNEAVRGGAAAGSAGHPGGGPPAPEQRAG
jgi:hypothetical protein